MQLNYGRAFVLRVFIASVLSVVTLNIIALLNAEAEENILKYGEWQVRSFAPPSELADRIYLYYRAETWYHSGNRNAYLVFDRLLPRHPDYRKCDIEEIFIHFHLNMANQQPEPEQSYPVRLQFDNRPARTINQAITISPSDIGTFGTIEMDDIIDKLSLRDQFYTSQKLQVRFSAFGKKWSFNFSLQDLQAARESTKHLCENGIYEQREQDLDAYIDLS